MVDAMPVSTRKCSYVFSLRSKISMGYCIHTLTLPVGQPSRRSPYLSILNQSDSQVVPHAAGGDEVRDSAV